jgi:hypothetical protein
MRLFKLDETYSVVCEFSPTRAGFRHIARLMQHGAEVSNTKICYVNRTWERFEFEDALRQVIDKFFTAEIDRIKYLAIVNTLN